MTLAFDRHRAHQARLDKGMGTRTAAKAVGVVRQTLVNIEDGTSVPGGDTLAAMADVYGVGVGFFFTGDDGSAPAEVAPENDRAPAAHRVPAR